VGGSIQVISNPTGAGIYGGTIQEYIHDTPYTFSISPAQDTLITVKHAGFYDSQQTVHMIAGNTVTASFTLDPIPPPAPTVNYITPPTGINTGSVAITNLAGSGFETGAQVMLTPVNANPVHKGSIVDGGGLVPVLWRPNDVYVSGNYAYVTGIEDSLEIVNVANPTNPVHVGNITSGQNGAMLDGPMGVYVSGSYAYVVSWNSRALEIFDVSTPANPVLTGHVDFTHGNPSILNGVTDVYVSGNYAYVTCQNSNVLEIFDVSNKAAPVFTTSVTVVKPINVYVSNNFAYVLSDVGDTLYIVDVSTPTAPVHKGSITNGDGSALLDNPKSVYVSGNYAYVASQDSQALEIVDVSNPADPVHAGSIVNGAGSVPYLAYPNGVAVSGNYAYVTNIAGGTGSLEVVNITNPAAPAHVGSIVDGGAGTPILNQASGLAVSGNYAYVISLSHNSLEIMDIGTVNTVTAMNVVSDTKITGPIDLTGKAAGPYNVVVTNPDGQFGVLSGGFTVTATPPTFTSAATNVAGTVITVTFNKAMASPVGKQAGFYYRINSGLAQAFNAAALNSETTKIDLTTSGTPIAYDDTVSVTYISTGTVQAADGGILAGFFNQVVTNAMPVPPAPTFSSATTNAAGTVITVMFNKAMASPVGKQGEFKYKINGGADQSFSAAALNGVDKFDLTTTVANIAYGNVVTVSYTVGTVTAADLGVLSSFAGQSVNNAMPVPPATPAPTLNYITPATGVNSGWVSIDELAGTGFDGSSTVKLTKSGESDISATNYDITPTRITCDFDLTGAAAGTWDVVVTTVGGTDTLTGEFTVTAAPPVIPGTIIQQGATVFIGEEGLDITPALILANAGTHYTTIGWWASAADPYTTAPTMSIDTYGRRTQFTITPSEFDGYEGQWYLVNTTSMRAKAPVFTVRAPNLDIAVWDNANIPVTGNSVAPGTRLKFRIETNMAPAVGPTRSPINPATDGYIDIKVRDPNGVVYTNLLNDNVGTTGAGPNSLRSNFVNTSTWYWGESGSYTWQTGALDSSASPMYPRGTYTVWAESTLHGMRDNYLSGNAAYTGRTVSQFYEVSLNKVDFTWASSGLLVHFTGSSTVNPTSWSWDVNGDGVEDYATPNPDHTYSTKDTYAVTLTATYVGDSDSETKPVAVMSLPSTDAETTM
jgi:hypothetical protein